MIQKCIFPAEIISGAEHDKYVKNWHKYFSMLKRLQNGLNTRNGLNNGSILET